MWQCWAWSPMHHCGGVSKPLRSLSEKLNWYGSLSLGHLSAAMDMVTWGNVFPCICTLWNLLLMAFFISIIGSKTPWNISITLTVLSYVALFCCSPHFSARLALLRIPGYGLYLPSFPRRISEIFTSLSYGHGLYDMNIICLDLSCSGQMAWPLAILRRGYHLSCPWPRKLVL